MSQHRTESEPHSTRFQYALIYTLLGKAELPARRTTLLHRIPFRAAGLPDPPVDRPIEPILQALTFAQASALINALKRQAGVEDDDDDEDQ